MVAPGVAEVVAADAALAWATVPAGLVIESGEENFGSVVACAEAASYRLIAPELFAHISRYSSSVWAIAGRLIPNRLVANNCASRVLLALTEATGTTDERAEL